VHKHRRTLDSFQVVADLARHCTGLVHIIDEFDQNLRRFGDVEVGPRGALHLHDLAWRVRPILMRQTERADDVFLGPSFGRLRGKAEVESTGLLRDLVFSSDLRIELDKQRAVLLVPPVIAAFDQSTLELLRQPACELGSWY